MLSEAQSNALRLMPATLYQIAEALGVNHSTALKLVRRLRKQKLCFIMKWDRREAVHVAGRGRDAPKPGRQPRPKKSRAKLKPQGPFAALYQIKP